MQLNFLLLFASVFTIACTGSKQMKSAADYTSITLKQGGCFGTCPVYTLTIDEQGAATYLGRRYAPFKGLHTATIAADTLAKLNSETKLVLAKAEELPREIDSGIADMAMSTISIIQGTDTLVFRGTSEYALPVKALRATLLSIAESSDWQRSPDAEPLPANQLLITLKAADQIQVVTEDYYRQQMKMVRLVKDNPPTVLVTFDPYTMSAEEMVRDLRRNKMVVRAEIVENQ